MKEQEFKSLSLAAALKAACDAQQVGDISLAETLYGWILEAHPENAEAMHQAGLILHQRGRQDDAIELVERSIRLDHSRPDWFNDLGNMRAAAKDLGAARAAFMASLEIDPNHALVWNNLGSVLQRQDHPDEAEFAYRQAIALTPGFVDALSNLGNLLSVRGRSGESAEYLCLAFVAAATDTTPKDVLGIAYNTLGRLDDAREVYRKWLQEEPDHPIARHLYAACSGLDVPPRASDAYVEMYFDELAKNFDVKLLENLDYQAPRLIGQMLERLALSGRKANGLDAGCGTGLCGVRVAPYVARLTGIDLSANMLALAKQKQIYDELEKVELTQFMLQHPGRFDLVVIADTLIYFGPLHPVFDAVRTTLRPAGCVVFTVEAPQGAIEPYGIKPNGRYGHGQNYLGPQLLTAGFADVDIQSAVIRIELGRPVNGFVVSARLAGA